MKEDEFYTVSGTSKGEYKERGSKFIAWAMPVKTEDEIKEKLQEIKNQYHDARHHCYAYQIGTRHPKYRVNDDGEPSSTAGKPIFGQIQSYNVTNIIVIVIRYFGGTKLGTSGLIRAYKTAAEEALKNARIIKKTINRTYQIEFEYPSMNDVMKLLHELNIEPFNKSFKENCVFKFHVRISMAENILIRFKSIKNLKIYDITN